MTLNWHEKQAAHRDETPQGPRLRHVVSWLLLWVLLAGSDSHELYTRATLFVGARARTLEALREGLLSGRVCTRAPDPCALTAYADHQPQRYGVGDAVTVHAELTLRWPSSGELFLDGSSIGEFTDEVTLRIPPDGCHLIRLHLAGGFSGPLYVNCPFAELPMSQAANPWR